MFLYNRHLHIPPEWSDTDKVLFQTCIRRPLYREYLPHEREYTGDFPSYLLQCAVFFPSFFSPVISMIFSITRCFYALWIDQCVTWFFIPSCLFSCYFDKMLHHFVPYAVLSCSAIKTPYRIMWRIVMRQHSPLAACLYDIQHCFYEWLFMIFAFISGWKEFFDCFPLFVCQITFVICCLIFFFHISYYTTFLLWTQALRNTL